MAGEPKFEVRGVGPELRERIRSAATAAGMGQSAWVIAAIEAQLTDGIRDTPAARDLRQASVNLLRAIAAIEDLDLRIDRKVRQALQIAAAVPGDPATQADQQQRPAGKARS